MTTGSDRLAGGMAFGPPRPAENWSQPYVVIDIGATGDRFVVRARARESGPRPLTLIEGWTMGLRP